jgi:hypothetical protein
MRSRQLPTQPPRRVEVDLADQLRAAATQLRSMPPESARSLSVTAGWQGWGEAQLRRVATEIATPLGFGTTVLPDGDVVTVTFRRRTSLD